MHCHYTRMIIIELNRDKLIIINKLIAFYEIYMVLIAVKSSSYIPSLNPMSRLHILILSFHINKLLSYSSKLNESQLFSRLKYHHSYQKKKYKIK